jgi:hypothetical protein
VIKFNTNWNKINKSFEIRYIHNPESPTYSTPLIYIGIYRPSVRLVQTYSIELRIKLLWLTITLRNKI